MVAVDGSEPSMRALRFAVGLVEDLDEGALVAVYARHAFMALPEDVAVDVDTDLFTRAEDEVRNSVQGHLADRTFHWTFEVRLGHPVDVIRDVAKSTDASFIAVGRTGWSAYRDILLGSVANRIVHQSDRPVLLVS